MGNPFKTVLQDEKLPSKIKSKVMNDIDLIKLTLDFADLITIKYPDIISDVLKKTKK